MRSVFSVVLFPRSKVAKTPVIPTIIETGNTGAASGCRGKGCVAVQRDTIMAPIGIRQREALRVLWREGRLSRWELHERTGVNPNAVGLDVADLLNRGIVRECASTPQRPGRPRVPLEIDPARRHVVGISLGPHRAEAGRLNLRGEVMGTHSAKDVDDPDKVVAAARRLCQELVDDRTLAIGLSTTGWVDQKKHSFSAMLPGRRPVSLEPIYQAAGDVPILLENDMHALGARWLLTHEAEADEDVLLVYVDEGRLGAAILIDGHPNRGSASGANEMGHTRFFVETDPCYCGHTGCLERICSTPFLRRQGAKTGTLLERARDFDGADAPLATVIDYLAMALANAVNFIRPNRLVLISELTGCPAFCDELTRIFRSRLLVETLEHLRLDLWDQAATQSAESAGWLALASLFREGWGAGAVKTE